MKIGFNLISHKDALWICDLRSKYEWKSPLPDSINRIGNGSTIRGWKDNWVPDVRPLYSYISGHDRLTLDSTLKDWVLQDGSWNVDMIRIWLPGHMISRIVSIPPPHSANGKDRIIWARSGLGAFCVRSAYWALKESSWRSKDDIWKLIWKYQSPQKVCLFLWLVANQRLLTNPE
ncbi:hypothetical protein J1N35_002939 [Gossypium stocksii]|uniref:Reverse transcriptase zinc-binding domain-containing protein n=1 Tax=Gossypium stocksii TaxID=47602 RepID=A0A9D3WMR7_9ROSI|nr:hypothetical protein J1N35_002939 [Gossypium stocksii]